MRQHARDKKRVMGICVLVVTAAILFLMYYPYWTVFLASAPIEKSADGLWVVYSLVMLVVLVFMTIINFTRYKAEKGLVKMIFVPLVGSILVGMAGMYTTFGACSLAAKIIQAPRVTTCYKIIEYDHLMKIEKLKLAAVNSDQPGQVFRLSFKRYLLKVPAFKPGDYALVIGAQSYFGTDVDAIERVQSCVPATNPTAVTARASAYVPPKRGRRQLSELFLPRPDRFPDRFD